MRYELDFNAYDPETDDEAESNLLFVGVRTVLYADATQVGGRTHRDVLEEMQRAVDLLTDRTKRRVYDPAENKVVEVPRNRLRPEGGRLGGKRGISKVQFELLKTAATPVMDRGGLIAKVAGVLQRTLDAAVGLAEPEDAAAEKTAPKKKS